MPDLRYHVISLISVFLALSVGILLGIAMSDRGVLDAQIKDIRGDLEQQRTALAERESRISRQDQLLSGMSETMISDRLQGVNVALVSGPWVEGETYRRVRDALSTAGANLVSAPPQLETPKSSSEDAYSDTSRGVLGYGESTTTQDEAPEVVIFLGGGEPHQETERNVVEATDTAVMNMLETWESSGVRVVAAEASGGERTQIPLFQQAGIPSVDNADSPSGRAAIVVLSLSTDNGSYGTGDNVSGYFPPSPQQ